MANDRSKFFFNVLALENILVALTRESGDGPSFLYIKFSWIGVHSEIVGVNQTYFLYGFVEFKIELKLTLFRARFSSINYCVNVKLLSIIPKRVLDFMMICNIFFRKLHLLICIFISQHCAKVEVEVDKMKE
jgi:Mn2+/Fe2+ NRAMP family transporter